MALTIKEIDSAKPNDKPYKLADSGGLCLLVPPSVVKLWRWRYRFDGKVSADLPEGSPRTSGRSSEGA